MEKFDVGPTTEKPGPTLLKLVATAEKVVIKSKLSRLTTRIDRKNIKK